MECGYSVFFFKFTPCKAKYILWEIKKRNEYLFWVIHYAFIIIYKTLFSEIILFLVQFCLLTHASLPAAGAATPGGPAFLP